ncbi:MAG: HAD family phosphatase [Alphaproteobacteria bacterium]
MDGTRPAILWDMDGTLVDSEPLHEAALVSALGTQGLTPPPDFHDHIVGRDAREVHRWCQHHLGLSLPLRDWLRLKYRVYFATVETLKPRSGAVDLFHRLREDGYRQAIVSNSDRMVVSANLDAVGLSDPGLITISRNDVRDGKPGGEPYLRAAWLLGADPKDCLVVEDSTTGAKAGLAAGMRTLFWPQTDLTAPKGAVAVPSLDRLEAIIMENVRR